MGTPPRPGSVTRAPRFQLPLKRAGRFSRTARWPWLTDVSGELDQLGRTLPSGQTEIPEFKGHGTFIAGVTKCVAPHATVFVNDHFTLSGAESESVMVAKLEELALRSPDIINLSAGTYTRPRDTAGPDHTGPTSISLSTSPRAASSTTNFLLIVVVK